MAALDSRIPRVIGKQQEAAPTNDLRRKDKSAAEVIQARQHLFFREEPSENEEAERLIRKIKGWQLEALIDVYLEFYADEELLAQAEFHRSKIGQSIAAANRNISKSYPARAVELIRLRERQSAEQGSR